MARARNYICVLVSGGVESAAMLASLSRKRRVFPVFVREGHSWERAELHWLKRLLRRLRSPRLEPLAVLELPVRDVYRSARWSVTGRGVPSSRTRDEAVYLPGRNVLLLAKAAVFCAERGIEALALGTLGSNPFPDSTPSFLKSFARVLSAGLGKPLRVETPFGRLHKEDVLRRDPGVPWGLSFSCIAPRGLRHCGRCNKCAERRRAFRRAGLTYPA